MRRSVSVRGRLAGPASRSPLRGRGQPPREESRPLPQRIRIAFLGADLPPAMEHRRAELRVDDEVIATIPLDAGTASGEGSGNGDAEAVRRIALDRVHVIERRPGEFFGIFGTLSPPAGEPDAQEVWVVLHTHAQGRGWGAGRHRAQLGPGLVVHYEVSET